MYRFNGGIRGRKVSNWKTAVGYIKSAIQPRGRHNGGFLGVDRLSDDLDENVNKTSGIWHLSTGLKFVESHAVVTTVDNSYYQQQPPEQRWNQTGSTRLGGGYQWNPHNKTDCPGPMWPQGSYGPHGGGNLSRTWTTVGQAAGCQNWVFDVYRAQGYYYTYYPPAIYVEQIDTQTTYHSVWDYFS